MKKFTKILGFLGFFVALVNVPIYAAHAVDCDAGQYLPGGSSACIECPGTANINGINQGVYCPGGKNFKENQNSPQGLSSCIDSCNSNLNNWGDTPTYASVQGQCKGTCRAQCSIPIDCTGNCHTIIEEVNGTINCGGTCTVAPCNTVTCNPDQCEDWNGANECVPKSNKTIKYECTENGNDFGMETVGATYGRPYTVNPSGHTCNGSSGQQFSGWKLVNNNWGPYQTGRVIDSWPCVDDPVVFRAEWSAGCYEVSFNDNANGGHANSTTGTHESFYKKHNDTQYKWYRTSDCDDKDVYSDAEVNVAGHLPEKEHAKFSGYFEEPLLAVPVQIFNGFDDNGSLSTFGETWTIRGAVELIPHYDCVDPYVLDPQTNNCVARSVKVNYVCVSPIDDTETTYSDPSGATYGQPYTVLRATCSYSGYTLDQRYQWELQGYNNTNNSNDHGLYEPGQEMNEWEYLTYSPITEITFKLGADAWTPGNYDVEYRCGTINGVQVGGDPTVDSGGARYGQNYTVAHPSIPSDFINACQEDSGYSVKNWSFACGVDGQEGYITVADPYDTNDVLEWTYARNDCYFTANWEQSGFVIILNQNGATNQSDPADYLYTTHNVNVYLDSNRTRPMQFNGNPLDVKPRKDVSVNFYANDPGTTGATFVYDGVTYPNSNNTYASVSVNLPFKGFYQNTPVSPAKYINEDGFITNDGRTAGIGYDINTPLNTRTWVAEWDRSTVTLPNEVTWSGHTFLGWYCTHGDNIPYSSDPINATLLIDDTTTCVAKWAVACYSVDFDDTTNKGENAHNGPLYKIANDTAHKWFTDSGCKNGWNSAEDPLTKPTKEHAQFLGYNTTVSGDGDDIFNGTPVLTPTGETWEISDNSLLYAQYECIFPYHLDTDTGSDTYNECVTCDSGYFWSETNGRCLNCDDYMHQDTEIIAMYPWVQNYTWTSKEPYNWSIDQCYYECDSQVCESTNVIDDVTEQFLSGQVNQISFFGNEKNGVRTCDAGTGAVYCPQGLTIISGFAAIIKPMAAAVTFDDVATGENNVRYIIGNRKSSPSSPAEMLDGRVWSQVVSDGQQMIPSSNSENAPDHTYTYIVYPTDRAPSPSTPAGYEFIGYGYPNTNPSEHMLVDNGILTNTNANDVIQFANGFETSYPEDMSPVISASRYLYPKYQQMVFNITYENMDNATWPDDWGTTMPDTYTCGVEIQITGVPTLISGHGVFAGWCTDPELTQCAMTQTISTDTTCGDKTFYAKWECNEPYYHLNGTHDACEQCVDGLYWDGTQCQNCPYGWTSKSGFNWSIDQCYHECTNGARCTVDENVDTLTIGEAVYCSIDQFVNGSGPHTQIEFYGNVMYNLHGGVEDHMDVCGSENANMYCPYGLSCDTSRQMPRSVPIKFLGNDDNSAVGIRFVVGQGTWESGETSGTMQSGERWSEFVGAGQKFILDEDNLANAYTLIVYPSYRAPDASWSGHEFNGYYSSRDATDDEQQTYVNPYVESNYELNSGNANTVGTGLEHVIPGTRALFAQYTTTCFEVTFNDTTNGGRSDDGTNGPLYVKPGEDNWVNRWYIDSTCETLWYNESGHPYGSYEDGNSLLILPYTPQMNNGHFIGYFDAGDTEVFQNNSGINHPIISEDGLTWTTDADTTLYAKYECEFPFHLSTVDGRLVCTACVAGDYYDSDDDSCHSCDEELGERTGISGWTSMSPYNWSINQCYRNCGGVPSDNWTVCTQTSDVTSGINQFVNGSTGTQISFYGNEFVGAERFNTCLESTGAKYCPQGLLGTSYGPALTEPIAAVVNFHGTATDDDKRWIMARRNRFEEYDTGLHVPLSNAFGWSQVVGLGQQRIIDGNHPNQTYIVYPSDSAPEAADVIGSNFRGYNDRDNEQDPIYIGQNRTLNSTNAGTVLGLGNYFDVSRNLYAQYEQIDYSITYDCQTYCDTTITGNVPDQETGIHYNGSVVPAAATCSCPGHDFHGWNVSNTEPAEIQQPGVPFTWLYDENKTFYADWGEVSSRDITYYNVNNIYYGADSNDPNVVLPYNYTSTTPLSYTCNNETTTISPDITGQITVPQLIDADTGVIMGQVVAWCEDSDLTINCRLPQTFQNIECTDKKFYAKWECNDAAGYHLNGAKDNCEVCPDDTVWDGTSCEPATTACPPNYPYTRSPYNWTSNNCFRYCNKTCENLDDNSTAIFDTTIHAGIPPKQIAFYGNERNGEPSVCDMDDVKYCPRVLQPRTADFKPKDSLVTFKKKGNTENAGTRYIVGDTNNASNGYFNNTGKWWSHIVGDGQRNPAEYGAYTLVIYPTDEAPEPSDNAINDPLFKGYYDAASNGTQRVTAALGLASSNAVAFPQSSLSGNQIGDRILYPQYCGEGQHWDESAEDCKPNTINIVYESDYGTVPSSITCTYGASFGLPAALTDTNHLFQYWKTDGDTNYNQFIGGATIYCTARYLGVSADGATARIKAIWDSASNVCQAQLPSNSNAHLVGDPTLDTNGNCVYNIQCKACIDTNPPVYSCYLHGTVANFSVTVPQGTPTLNNATCDASSYDVYYRCNPSENGIQSEVPAIYGQPYTVEDNGDTVNCSQSGAQFSGWTFSGNAGQTYVGGSTINPWLYYNLFRPTFTAVFNQCDEYQYYENGQCKDCPDGFQANLHPNSANECYRTCPGQCQESGCTTGINHITDCNYTHQEYTGYEYYNDQGNCYYNQQHEFLQCEYTVECESGYYVSSDGHSCEAEGKYVISLEPNVLNGTSSNPDTLYTIHDTGVYLDYLRSDEMSPQPNGINPLNSAPINYAIVTFDLNGTGASVIWNDSTYIHNTTSRPTQNVDFTFRGFYDAVDGSAQYINSDRYITDDGLQEGKGYTDNTHKWYAQWQAGTIDNLPNPARSGYTFVGWYDTQLPIGGNQLVPGTIINNDIIVYARWKSETYVVTLDKNGGVWGQDPLDTLYQEYGTGWARSPYGTFELNLPLTPDELPRWLDTTKVFKGYYDAANGGNQKIKANGVVIASPTLTDNTVWYAQYEDNNGPFTVRFKCEQNGPDISSSSVYHNGTINVPQADVCTNPGHTFTGWQGIEHDIQIQTPLPYSMQWSYHYGETFIPKWDTNVYHITLNPNQGTPGNVQNLYEKYDVNWYTDSSLSHSIEHLTGNQLPTRTGYTFRGYMYGNTQMVSQISDGVWGLPNPRVIGNQIWYADWSKCDKPYQYYENGECHNCESDYQYNQNPQSHEDCMARCEQRCREPNYQSCMTEGVAEYDIDYVTYYGTINWPNSIMLSNCVWDDGFTQIPVCDCHPTSCKPGYTLLGNQCVKNAEYTIALDSDYSDAHGTASIPQILYTIQGTGVYRNSGRTEEMTTSAHPLNQNPRKYAIVTLKTNANDSLVSWGNTSGTSVDADIDFVFNGFYEGTNNYIGSNGYITSGGQDAGISYTNSGHTWKAQWTPRSVNLPDPSPRAGYTFDGWWTAANGGERRNNPVSVSTDMTLWAHWIAKTYDVTYSCGNIGWGTDGVDTERPTYGAPYIIKDNNFVVSCSRPGYGFTNWTSNWDYNEYWPGSITWTSTINNPTFTAKYELCNVGQYVGDGSCKDCPGDYTDTNPYDATQITQCYKKCDVDCTYNQDTDCPHSEGVLYCNPDTNYKFSGTMFWPSEDCNINAESTTCPYTVVCDRSNGYEWDEDLRKCIRIKDQYTITLDQNGGIGGQAELYTIYQTNVYRDAARTEAMSTNGNPLLRHPEKSVTVTFNYCDGGNNGPSCDNAPRITTQPVDLDLNGYNDTQSSNSERYISKNSNDGKYYITSSGLAAGKGYSNNNQVWYANWAGNTVSPWPYEPTYVNNDMLPITYRFGGWWTESQCGIQVYQTTMVDSNRTWYAHWCAQCPSTVIEHGTCTQRQQVCGWCDATIKCDTGYEWDNIQKKCLPITGLKITYRPNGGTPNSNIEAGVTYGESFTTLDSEDTFTKAYNRLINWKRSSNNCSNLPQSFELNRPYTYDCNVDTTLDANWKECECRFSNNSGVQSCTYPDATTAVINNACHPTVVCKDRYVHGDYSCDGQYLTDCTARCEECEPGWISMDDECKICGSGTYQDDNECISCPDGYTSDAGSDSIEDCYGKKITIDWGENGGHDLQNGQCTYGQMFNLANKPEYDNVHAFLGWLLADGTTTKSAEAEVMCNFDNVGVYEGLSDELIKAQWELCECTPQNDYTYCMVFIEKGVCNYYGYCWPEDGGYQYTVYGQGTSQPRCEAVPRNFMAYYSCGTGATGNAPSPDQVTYNTTYEVRDNPTNNGCAKNGATFSHWVLEGQRYDGGTSFIWRYTSDETFVAQYNQCDWDQVVIDGECQTCECVSEDQWNGPVESCIARKNSDTSCTGTGECPTGYTFSISCNGAVCTPTCTQKTSYAEYECGNGANGNPPVRERVGYGDMYTVKGNASCYRTNYTFEGWSFSGGGYYNSGDTIEWIYESNQLFTGQWCKNCGEVPNGRCTLNDLDSSGECVYETVCNDGYTCGDTCGTANPVCTPSDYTIEYQANGGVNVSTGVKNKSVLQNVKYLTDFVTQPGTIFRLPHQIITRWNHVEGGEYPELFSSYPYITRGNTILAANWVECTCTSDNSVASCEVDSNDNNKCAIIDVECTEGYGPNYSGTCNQSTGECTVSCNAKKSNAIYDCGEGAAGTPPTPQSVSYGTSYTIKDKGYCRKDGYTFNGWYFDGTDSYHNAGTTVNWLYEIDRTFTAQWCEACVQPTNGTCTLNVDTAHVCKYATVCDTGYTCGDTCLSSNPICEADNTLAIHYRSNNGLNQTYDQQPITYSQPFTTEAGTRFTNNGYIMTRWDVIAGGTNTFSGGVAQLGHAYSKYLDEVDTTLDAHWKPCTCTEVEGVVAGSCSLLSTNDNTCGCLATCNDGLRFAGCNCNGTDGTACSPVCEPVTSNAVYTCGSGTGAGHSESVAFGATYHIKNNTWCVKDKSTFAGWKFYGDNVTYGVGDTITWNYKNDSEFMALWCPSCSDPADHCELTIPNPGECQVTCDTGYRWDSDQKKCVAKTDLRLTYQPNGGKPNQNKTDFLTYGQSFTTKSGTTYTKARHIMTHWNVESGGEHTFTAGIAQLNSPYTYKTDGDTVLSAQWQECADGTIVIGNECVACSCTEGAGVVHNSCSVQSTDNNLCTGTVECQDGYVGANVSCDGAQCTATCNACQSNEVSVNGECVECECTYTDDSGVASCGTSVVRNTCTQDPTCKPGYANPTLDCGGAGNAKCDAKCEICPAGTYGPDGHSCKPCPNGKTSYPGSTSINQCFIDPGSCDDDEHVEQGVCVPNVMECAAPDAYLATRTWNASIGTYGPCIIESCIEGYHILANTCVLNTCSISHGHGEYDSGSDTCYVTKCDPGYYESGNACVECENKIVDGDVAVSSYVSECEIAACMYQGQKYALDTKNNECVPICTADRFTLEDPDNPTGTIQWDERTKKCIRTCNPGYKMW